MPDVEQSLDELYAADPGDFAGARKRLAKELKDAGDADAAAVVGGARKPTLAAWALNQLARRRRKQVDLLLDAGHRLRQAQAGLLRGEGQRAFAAARSAEQAAITALVKEARGLLAAHGPVTQATVNQVTDTLRAAAVSDDGRQLLAVGRFVKPLTGTSGFETVAALVPKAPPPRTRARRAASDAEVREARAALRAAEQRQRRLERDAAAAEEELQRLRAELAESADRTNELRAEARAAAAAAAEAARRLRAIEVD